MRDAEDEFEEGFDDSTPRTRPVRRLRILPLPLPPEAGALAVSLCKIVTAWRIPAKSRYLPEDQRTSSRARRRLRGKTQCANASNANNRRR